MEMVGPALHVIRIHELDFSIDRNCVELNVMEIRPPRMDDSGRSKYPVLFYV
jgi:hypothetical protein